MLKRKIVIIGFLAFCLSATFLIDVTSSAPYDPWMDTNDDGIIDIVDLVNLGIRFGQEGTPINKTELLLGLQERVGTVEEQLNQVKTIRFYEPNETTNDQQTYKNGAVFVWTPDNSTNNGILSIYCYFQYRCTGPNGLAFRIGVNDDTSSAEGWLTSVNYTWTPVYEPHLFESSVQTFPNQNSYTIRFQFQPQSHLETAYVKDINILMEVADGLPASNG